MVHANTAYDLRQTIRSRIRPFPAHSPEKRTFTVGWTDCPQTFEQIIDALRPRIVNDLLYFKKVAREYISELVQQGWLRLWQALTEDANTLTELTEVKAADFVTNRCGSSVLHNYLRRYQSYHHLSRWDDPNTDVYEDNITEIVIGSSLKSSGHGRHAFFTRVVDRLVDIGEAIREVAEWCLDDIRKLAALYYITTSVSQVDAGLIAGMEVRQYGKRKKCASMQYWTKQVSARLKEVFAEYCPKTPNRNFWREQINKGHLEPVIELAHKYSEDTDKLLALYVLTTSVGRETVVKECGVNDSALWYAMKQIRQELRCIYASRVRNTI